VVDNKIEDDIRDYDYKDCNSDSINHVVVLTRVTISWRFSCFSSKRY